MIQKIKAIANDLKWIEILFTLMILSFPFGSFFLSFSIGFMTIYPYLVLVCLLTFLGFFKTQKIDTRLEKYFLYFLILFFVYALAFLPFVDGKKDAIIDLRSIVLMVMTSYVFISVSKILGFEKWKEIILFSFKLIFFLVLSFSIFEIISGIHFTGAFTEKIIVRGLSDDYSKTPVFLWDNPNNLMAYMLLIGVVIILLSPRSKQKVALSWLIILAMFILAFIAKSRVGMISTFVVAGFTSINQLKDFFQQNSLVWKKSTTYILFSLLTLTLIFFTQQKFYRIPLEKERVYRSTILKSDQLKNQNKTDLQVSLSDTIKPAIIPEDVLKLTTTRDAAGDGERIGLLKNGVDFIFDSNFLGVGPGQYRYLHSTGQQKHNTFGNNGPHFWFLELISQYGVFVFLLYIILLAWIFVRSLKELPRNFELASNINLALFSFLAASFMPSGFLILDINWIFIAILVVVCANYSNAKSEAN